MTTMLESTLTAEDRETIRALTEREWTAACLARDWDKALAMCAPDIVYMPADHPVLRGHAALRAWLDQFPPILKHTQTLWLALASALLLAACSQTPPSADTSEADVAAMRAASDAWIAAWNAGDVAALANTYAEDAVEMAPDEFNEGREAIVRSMTDYFARFTATQTATTDEVSVHGDVAVVRGTWSLQETPKSGGPEQTRRGRWVEVQRRQADGSWKTWRWMWNQESPAPATP